jgi:hypothetical protein
MFFYVGYPPDPLYTRGRSSPVSQKAWDQKIASSMHRCAFMRETRKRFIGFIAVWLEINLKFLIVLHIKPTQDYKKACLAMFIFTNIVFVQKL